jgi:hypothetical protein
MKVAAGPVLANQNIRAEGIFSFGAPKENLASGGSTWATKNQYSCPSPHGYL